MMSLKAIKKPLSQLLYILALLNAVSKHYNLECYSGLLISGGSGVGAGVSVEVYVPSTGLQYHLPNLPGNRSGHTMEEMTLCGGVSTRHGCTLYI